MIYLRLSLTKYVENLNTEYYKTLLRKIKGLNKRRYVYGLVDLTVLTYELPPY